MFYGVRFLLRIACLCVVLAVTGCMFMSDEDRDFYGKGWVRPSDLDKPLPHRAIPDPSHPEYRDADVPAQTAAATPEPQWLVPEQAPH